MIHPDLSFGFGLTIMVAKRKRPARSWLDKHTTHTRTRTRVNSPRISLPLSFSLSRTISLSHAVEHGVKSPGVQIPPPPFPKALFVGHGLPLLVLRGVPFLHEFHIVLVHPYYIQYNTQACFQVGTGREKGEGVGWSVMVFDVRLRLPSDNAQRACVNRKT